MVSLERGTPISQCLSGSAARKVGLCKIVRDIGKSQPIERRAHYGQNAIAGELAVDAHIELTTVFGELPCIELARGGQSDVDAPVIGQVLRRHRWSVPLEVGRRTDDCEAPIGSDADGDHIFAEGLAQADSGVDLLFDDVGEADRGMNFFDTAEICGPWTNEEMVGEAFADMRDKSSSPPNSAGTSTRRPGEHRGGVNSKPAQIRQSVEGSLRRIGTDYIDLYYQHLVDPDVPMEDVAGVVRDLIQQGKVRFLGLSEAGVGSIRRAHHGRRSSGRWSPLASLRQPRSSRCRRPFLQANV
jgi:hypothetical protein